MLSFLGDIEVTTEIVFLPTWKDPSGHRKQWENKLRFYINGQHCVIYKERA